MFGERIMESGVYSKLLTIFLNLSQTLRHFWRSQRLWRVELEDLLYTAKGFSWTSRLIFITNYLGNSRQVTLSFWVFVFPMWKTGHGTKWFLRFFIILILLGFRLRPLMKIGTHNIRLKLGFGWRITVMSKLNFNSSVKI